MNSLNEWRTTQRTWVLTECFNVKIIIITWCLYGGLWVKRTVCQQHFTISCVQLDRTQGPGYSSVLYPAGLGRINDTNMWTFDDRSKPSTGLPSSWVVMWFLFCTTRLVDALIRIAKAPKNVPCSSKQLMSPLHLFIFAFYAQTLKWNRHLK